MSGEQNYAQAVQALHQAIALLAFKVIYLLSEHIRLASPKLCTHQL